MSDTISVNKKYLEEILEESRNLREEVVSVRKQLDVANRRVAYLEGEVKNYRRKLFGKKSEKLPKDKPSKKTDLDEELKLDDNDKTILKKLLEEDTLFSKTEDPNLPTSTSLPTECVEIDLEEHEKYCLHCSGQMHRMGEEVSNQLEYVEPSIKIKKTVRLKYGCRHCEIEVKVP